MKIPTFAILTSVLILPLASAGEMKSSRLLASEEAEQQLQLFSSRLAINERDIDPFGQVQDLNSKVQETTIGIGKPGPKPIAFAKVVDTIHVVAVAPAEGRVIANGRTRTIGQKLKVPYKGVNYEVELTAVAEHEIEFKNVNTAEKATLKFKGAVANPLQKDDW